MSIKRPISHSLYRTTKSAPNDFQVHEPGNDKIGKEANEGPESKIYPGHKDGALVSWDNGKCD